MRTALFVSFLLGVAALPAQDREFGTAVQTTLTQIRTEPEAFKWIQRAAMDRRTTMKRVAEVVLETLDTPTEDASGAEK